jgi:hypothetical protein
VGRVAARRLNEGKAFYNGVTPEQVKTTSKIGVHNWKDKIIGRGLLIDVYR